MNINDTNDRPDPISGYPAIVGDGASGIVKRDARQEGAYVVPLVYAGTRLYRIECVNGDATVTTVSVTRDEAICIIQDLTTALVADVHRDYERNHGVHLEARPGDTEEVANLKKAVKIMIAERDEARVRERHLEFELKSK